MLKTRHDNGEAIGRGRKQRSDKGKKRGRKGDTKDSRNEEP